MPAPLATEDTPLLLHPTNELDDVYSKFSISKKRYLVLLISCCGLMALLTAGTFIPAIPQIAADLNTTQSMITLAVSLAVFATSLGSLTGAAYSTYHGRRFVYLISLPLFSLASIGVASSQNVPMLMVLRFLQALGASPGFSLGSAVIGDIFKLEERGSAMGVFLAACLMGAPLAPPIGGFVTAYASWCIMQLCLAMTGVCLFTMFFFFFPETMHSGTRDSIQLPKEGRKPLLINPFRPLWLLRGLNLLAVSLAGFFVLLTHWILLVPVAQTIGAHYMITSPALIGACLIPSGVGNMVGAPLGGRISDRIVVRLRAERNGIWYPEDRLWITLPAALYLAPPSILIFALTVEYIPAPVGLLICLACLFVNGMSVDMVLGPVAAYVVDSLRERSAEGIAAVNSVRAFLIAVSVSGIVPCVEQFGLLPTYSVVAVLAWVGYGLLRFTISCGNELRTVPSEIGNVDSRIDEAGHP